MHHATIPYATQYNQQNLRAEEYIHLRDAIISNADAAEIGLHSTIILYRQPTPHARICSGRFGLCVVIWRTVFIYHVHAQSKIAKNYISAIVRTKCNYNTCIQIKVKVINTFHYEITCFWSYTLLNVFSWMAKRRLPHAHILVLLVNKSIIILAEISNRSTDQLLFDIVTANMIYDPCGNFNRSRVVYISWNMHQRIS